MGDLFEDFSKRIKEKDEINRLKKEQKAANREICNKITNDVNEIMVKACQAIANADPKVSANFSTQNLVKLIFDENGQKDYLILHLTKVQTDFVTVNQSENPLLPTGSVLYDGRPDLDKITKEILSAIESWYDRVTAL
ncbi:hypothetical protein AAC03nite_38130 [Alicyclobacillus acidoterrestris]|nr:hypothetical protein AAC03nite_38130 [Alicyclobacillus acidoterrestris]